MTDETAESIEFSPAAGTSPTSQSLTINGLTTINNPSYSAVYSQTNEANHTLDVYIGAGVSITSVGGSGAVWLRNDTSGDITIDSSATVTATGGPAITLTTNLGSVSLTNRGHVTSTDDRGLYADGGYNNNVLSPALVTISNTGTVEAYTAGIRSINYQGLSKIVNSGTVTASTRQGLVAWSANGSVTIANSGLVTARDDHGLQAMSTSGNVTVTNSGTINAYNDTSITDAGSGHSGIATSADTSGNTFITNTGTVYAPNDTAISANADNGDISIVNSGTVNGRAGIDATTASGKIAIDNSGSISASAGNGVVLRGARLTNTGTISASNFGVYLTGTANSITTSGTIGGNTAAVFYGAGQNSLNIRPGSVFNGIVDYNNTSGNTTTFGAGSYRIAAANYIANSNTITLDNGSQVLILTHPDTNGTINVVSAPPVANIASQYTGAVSDVIGSILSLDIERPAGGPDSDAGQNALGYGESKRETPAQQAIKQIQEGGVVDRSGNLFWARIFGGGRHQPSNAASSASDIYNYGFITGVDRQIDEMRVGFFAGAGAINADLAGGNSSLNGRTGFLGIYGAAPVGGLVMNTSLTVGAIDNSMRRWINGGSEVATSDFRGWYVAPEATLSKRYDVAPEWTLTPSVQLRYIGAFYDSYTETGSSQNISYAARQTHTLEGRLQMELAKTTKLSSGHRLATTFTGALVDSQNLGSNGYAASLDNAQFTFADSSERNIAGLRIGTGFDLRLRSGMSLYGGVEGTVYSDKSLSYRGRLGLKAVF